MAQRTVVHLIDDLDGGVGEETVGFGLDGVQYEIDLSKEHSEELREFLAPYVGTARKLSGPQRAARASSGTAAGRRKDLADIRAWAQENGFDVKPRGRIPANIVEAYDAAH